MDRNLCDEVRSRTETVESELARILARHAQRTPADQAGTHQRREMRCVASKVERQAVRGVGDDVRGEPTVAPVPGEERRVTQIFATGVAVRAVTAGVSKPWDANPCANAGRVADIVGSRL